jgi:hypothetical protein
VGKDEEMQRMRGSCRETTLELDEFELAMDLEDYVHD